MNELFKYLSSKGINRMEIEFGDNFCRITDWGESPSWVIECSDVEEAFDNIKEQLESTGRIESFYKTMPS